MARKTFYYHVDEQDDFGGLGVNHKPLKDDFRYINKNIFYRIFSFILYYFIAFPILYIFSKIVLVSKVKNKKQVKKELKKQGFFLYSNHTHYYDAFLSHIFIGVPRRVYVISHPDAVNIPFIGSLVMMLGCLPLPSNIKTFKNFQNAMKQRLNENAIIAVYPEGTLWPYYNKIRKMNKAAFKYPAMYKKPIVICAETYKQRKIFKNLKPKMTLTLSHVIYPNKDYSVEENQNMFYEEAMKFWSETVLKEDNYSYNNYVLVEEKSNLNDNEQK